jgi:hypothetical protein
VVSHPILGVLIATATNLHLLKDFSGSTERPQLDAHSSLDQLIVMSLSATRSEGRHLVSPVLTFVDSLSCVLFLFYTKAWAIMIVMRGGS